MDDFLGGEENARFLHVLENDRVGVVNDHAGVFTGVVGVATLIVDRDDHVHTVALAGLIVVRAEAGRSVDAARAGVHGDIVSQNQTGGLREERMACEHVLIETAGMGLDDGIMLDLADVHDLLAECFGHDIHFAVILIFHDDVAFHRVECNREVAGKRPDRGRPDDEVEL